MSIRNRTKLSTVLRLPALTVPVMALGILSACATGPELEVPEPDSSGLPAGTVPATLPPPPPPDVIPGLQQSAEDAAIGTVTPAQEQDSIQGGPILGGIPINRDSITDARHPLSKRIVFFDYNSSRLTGDSLDLIRGHAEYLSRFSDCLLYTSDAADE